MCILRELWTGEGQQEEQEKLKTTYQYVLELRERLEDTCTLAHAELKKAQVKQKKWYDKKTRPKLLKPGDKALLQLPTEKNKLLMQWKGPYKVIKKGYENDYLLDIDGKLKTFHANMLKKYVERKPMISGAVVVCNGSLQLEIVQGSVIDQVKESEEMTDVETMCCPVTQKETWVDVKYGTELDEHQKQEAMDVCLEFQDILTDDIPGEITLDEWSVTVTDDETIRLRPHPTPFALQEERNDEVRTMLKMGVIEPSQSSYSSPPVVLRKPDGSCRYAIDFRRLNANTVFDAEPIPHQEVILGKLGKAYYITRIDLTKGFWQIPIKKEDRHLTAFQTDMGLMQFRMMPFWLVNALQFFCRVARRLLQGLEHLENYVNDIFIFTVDWKPHLDALRAVFWRLREHGGTARPSKCEIGFKHIVALGHLVGGGEMRPQVQKVDKILQVRHPQVKKKMRSFLGMVGYYRKFVKILLASPSHRQIRLRKVTKCDFLGQGVDASISNAQRCYV